MTAGRDPERRRVLLFYVQSLLGIGHLVRAAALARGFDAAGYRVHLVSGGPPAPGLDIGTARLHQLPPLHSADGDFSVLLDRSGDPVDATWRAQRRDRLLALFEETAPSAVMVETFPFGRRQMRFELVPLLDAAAAARPRPLILCSVRDVLQTGRRRDRVEESASVVEAYFDHVLVHGDPALIRFDETFPLAERIADKLQHTGYIGGAPAERGREGDDGWDEVIVSAGGGAVGEALVETALAARPRSALGDKIWRILVGHRAPQWARDAEQEGVVVEPARPDFRQLLANCAVSLSQGGYNTVMDILVARCPAVVVPFTGTRETEQALRARRLAEAGRIQVVAEDRLAPETVAAALDRAARRGVTPLRLALDGADRTVRLVNAWLDTAAGNAAS